MTEILRKKEGERKVDSALSAFIRSRTEAEDARTPAHILADCSGSMAGEKIQRLRTVLDRLRSRYQIKIIAFGHEVRYVVSLPDAGGGTPLAEALALAHQARRVVVLSDGEPDDEYRALKEALRLTAAGVSLSACYIGPPSGPGYNFLSRLTSQCGGKMANIDLLCGEAAQLQSKIAGLLSS